MPKATPYYLLGFLWLVTFGTAIAQRPAPAPANPNEARLMRFPTLHTDRIVFSYAGDLYTVSRSGGVARKLTRHEGYETFPRFSPDGQTLAFTAQYGGTNEVYVMPANGGSPTRLTYTPALDRDDVADRMGPNNIAMTWTPDGKNVVFRTRGYSFNDWKGQLFSAPVAGGLPTQLPFSVGSWCSYSADGKKMAYNRVFREFRTWKYYRGGMADDIWIYNTVDGTSQNITNNPAQDIFPMWHQNKIYFCSDRDRIMNLFVYDIQTSTVRKVTNFTEYDIKFPSLGPDGIVFENGGHIHILNLQTEQVRKVDIQIQDDFSATQSEWVDASQNISSATFSPDGQRVLLAARGDVWTLPAETGVTRNLTHTSNAHDRSPVWSPDGKLIAFISDRTGEDEIYVLEANNPSATPRQITQGGDTYKYSLRWSPDNKRIMWSDKKMRLQMVEVTGGRVIQVASTQAGEIHNYEFSPDGKWVIYTMPSRESNSYLMLFQIERNTQIRVTDGFYSVGNASFSNDGKYLVFSSNRDFNGTYSGIEWNYAYFDMTRVYIIPLARNTPSPFAPRNNEVGGGAAAADTASSAAAARRSSPPTASTPALPTVVIDTLGLSSRTIQIPHEASNYWNVQYADGRIYYMRIGQGEDEAKLCVYDLAKREEKVLGAIDGYLISDDGKKMMVIKGKDYYVMDRPVAGNIELKTKVDKGGMRLLVNRRQEWTQIFNECWRQMRDFFYAPNMHGVDWPAIRRKYEVLLPFVNHRNDLNYIIGEMIGELNCGHAYVGGGDRPTVQLVRMGLLGADLSRHSSGYYRIDRIYNGENWDSGLRSPLTEPGVTAQEGWYIIAINGMPTNTMPNIYVALMGLADRQVELTIGPRPDMREATTSIVVPLSSEADLRYHNWVQDNMRRVSQATNGQVGYLHVPDMVTRGLNQFVRYYYPQLGKKGMIIDVRGNGGGNVSPMIIERLGRQLAMVNVMRNGEPYANPFQMHLGPKVMVCDRYSASDGDLVCYRFKKYRLGKLVGERTWGGVVGIRGSLPLIDGGYLNRPEFAPFDTEGREWIIEGHGVEPDIVVSNDPAAEYMGQDPQLDRAIEEVQAQLRSNPQNLPPTPAYPTR